MQNFCKTQKLFRILSIKIPCIIKSIIIIWIRPINTQKDTNLNKKKENRKQVSKISHKMCYWVSRGIQTGKLQ